MTGRGQAPGWTGPEPGAFQARAGDTTPGAVMPRRHRVRKVVLRTLGVLVAVAVLAVAGFGLLLLITPSAGQAEQLAQAQDRAHNVAYPGPPVPARFAAALVATEDHRFYSDPGVDPIAVFRVAWGYLRGDGPQQGGATITQQLAKLLYTPDQSSLKAEAEQVAMAVKLNFSYSKAQILQMYADVNYYGQNYYSLGAASCGYFGVPPAQLTWSQSALLAGAVNGPTLFDPLTHPAAARARESHVLSRLSATGVLTPEQASAALAAPLNLVPSWRSLSPPPAGSDSCGGLRD